MSEHTPVRWLTEFKKVLDSAACRVCSKPAPVEVGLEAVAAELRRIRERNAGVWWIGNGGSAALGSHLSQDLLNKLGIRSQALTDVSLLTCMANDFGYQNVYARPLEVLARPGDLIIAVSSSGRSANILACARLAKDKGLRLITLSAFDAHNPLWTHDADVAFYLPTSTYGHAELGHEALLHAVIESL